MSIRRPTQGPEKAVADWWRTDIIDMTPGEIGYYGYPIEALIGNVSFTQMIWLMTQGSLPSPEKARMLDAALMSAVDHGPQAPSIAIARMAATCGVGLNNAMASAVNVLGDVHGGAGEQAMAFYQTIDDIAQNDGVDVVVATQKGLEKQRELFGKFIPGFGHRFHPVDPRAPRLMAVVEEAKTAGMVEGRFLAIAQEVEVQLEKEKGKKIPMNIDGATAVTYAELGVAPELARGLLCLSRSVGILAHAWEQTQQGGRNKGPIPRDLLWTYDGPAKRSVPDSD